MTEERPTGIIRTLPSLAEGTIGHKKMKLSFSLLEHGTNPGHHVLIALSSVPTKEVLHIYLLIAGEIRYRLNIAEYISGDADYFQAHPVKCWDGSYRRPRVWAVCTAPLSRPPEPIKMRGFQGYRYTTDLW